jgi:hypothetical protein
MHDKARGKNIRYGLSSGYITVDRDARNKKETEHKSLYGFAKICRTITPNPPF